MLTVSIFLVIMCCIIPASAFDYSDKQTEEVVTPLYKYTNDSKALPIYGDVIQGETNVYYFHVPSNINKLEIILDWDNSQNSLSLDIMKPNNYYYNTFYDNYDNQINSRIPIGITGNPVTNGYWRFEVGGHNVIGTQNFSLTINAL